MRADSPPSALLPEAGTTQPPDPAALVLTLVRPALVLDPQGCILAANDAFLRRSGYSRFHLIGSPVALLGEGSPLKHPLPGEHVVELPLPLDEMRFGRLVIVTAPDGEPAAITAGSAVDPLTRTMTPQSFLRTLHGVASAYSDRSLALLVFDVDSLRLVNDAVGRRGGDALLRQVAQLLEAQLEPGAALGRLDGNRFAMLLAGPGLNDAVTIGERCRAAIERLAFSFDDRPFTVTASVGVAVMPAGGDPDELVSRAESALGAAKLAGRNRVEWVIPDVDEPQRRRQDGEWISRIRFALDHQQFVLFAQPIVPVAGTQRGRHFEILVRMTNPDGSLVPPGLFIPVAERYGLSVLIDEWVVRATFNFLATLPHLDEQVGCCAINLSAKSIDSGRIKDVIVDALASSGIHPACIAFEVTETAALFDTTRARRFVDELAALGFRFGIDDFGTGFSSFSQLRTLPVDFVKIDGSLVRDIAKDPVSLEIVRGIHGLARVLGKESVAEFVEDDAILARLHQIGVDHAQGYGVGKPRPIQSLFADAPRAG